MAGEIEYLVAGAGPAGSTIARILALRGRPVLLVDPETHVVDRLEVLAPASLGTVSSLDLLHVLDDGVVARPCQGIRKRWSSPKLVHDDFLSHRHARGYVVDRRKFDRRLRDLAETAGARTFRGRAELVRGTGARPVVRLSHQGQSSEVQPRVVIDATGRPAALARRAGARWLFRERLVSTLLATNTGSVKANAPAWLDVEAGPKERSWTYHLSGPDGRDEVWRVVSGSPAEPSSTRPRVDASSGLLSVAAGAGWIAVGDAVACFDPITSQGLANAFSTAMVAAGIVLSASGLDEEAAAIYTAAVRETFDHSESGRLSSYEALRTGTLVSPHPESS